MSEARRIFLAIGPQRSNLEEGAKEGEDAKRKQLVQTLISIP